jgi:SAM-dependent methyltransferase
MDLSEAVEAAYVNTAEFPTVHVIQANIYRPPLRPMFDLVYCVGVIQHLPNPRTGFISLTGLLKKGAVLFVWVYGQRRGIYRVVDIMRKGTVHLPLRILYPLTFALNIVSHVLFSWPHTLLSHFPGLNRVAALWPFKRYAELPFRVGHADWFDRLSAPSTVYFSKDEVAGWFDETGLQNVKIQSRENIGWRGLGQVPRNAVE